MMYGLMGTGHGASYIYTTKLVISIWYIKLEKLIERTGNKKQQRDNEINHYHIFKMTIDN